LLTIGYRGGEEVLLDVGGQDSTEAFEDVGHSDEAREILDGLLVGTLKRQVCPLHTTYSAPKTHHMRGTLQPSAEKLGKFSDTEQFRRTTRGASFRQYNH
jgi:cytochrome b involved in lipid metabolism